MAETGPGAPSCRGCEHHRGVTEQERREYSIVGVTVIGGVGLVRWADVIVCRDLTARKRDGLAGRQFTSPVFVATYAARSCLGHPDNRGPASG